MNIQLRKIKIEDLEEYKHWRLPHHKYHDFNGPYFKKSTAEEVEIEIQSIREKLQSGNENPLPYKMIISNDKNELIGELNWYWKSIETNWLEIGLVIFDETNWSKGIGYKALTLWIDYIFEQKRELVRIGLTTWSGNLGMMKLAEKLGMYKEAQYKKARIVKSKYYDSISYGILKEEWKKTNEPSK